MRLVELNIEDNKLNDKNINLVIDGLTNNYKLKILNISKNLITD